MKQNNGWEIIADSKKVGEDGWLPEYNRRLQKYRGFSDAGTHFMITKRMPKRGHFQIWGKKKVRPSKPEPWFNLRRVK
tara:strand:+ start:119 stop:352 length:234 start_codon:yes stop_codon:yes gene_type:complete